MTTFDEVKMKISAGDTITSKLGILSSSPLTDKWYIWHKATYNGDGLWRCHDKEEVDVEVMKR